MLKIIVTRSAALVMLCSVWVSAHAVAEGVARRPINIPAEDLATALEQLSKQSGTDLVYRPDQVRGFSTRGLVGEFTAAEAVTKLLTGTPLTVSSDSSGALMIAAPLSAAAVSATGKGQVGAESAQEGGKQSSQDFRVAQVDQASAGPPVGTATEENPSSRKTGLEEVVVTGSRLPRTELEGPQPVQIYSQVQIEQSGQSSVSDFLNTIPSVSLASTEFGYGAPGGSTSVTLHGLSIGTTLVLINGRRVETSGPQALGQNDFFDLNNIPLAAVERIEVLADGASAVYGSDAIGGVVNIILKKRLSGLEANAQYGAAADTHETRAAVAWGGQWDRASASIVGSFQDRAGLVSDDRKLTASNDYTAYGGPNGNYPTCTPGNVFSVDGNPLPGAPSGSNATYAAVAQNGPHAGKPPLSSFNYGTLNQCTLTPDTSLIPSTRRYGLYTQGSYAITPVVELFGELMYSHVEQLQHSGDATALFGEIGFQSMTASAANPYNPFGTVVGIGRSLNEIGIRSNYDTDFLRPLVGVRGDVLNKWHWELAAWQSADWTKETLVNTITDTVGLQNALNSSEPSVALNPFVAGPIGPYAEVQSFFSNGLFRFSGRTQSVSAFAHGPVVELGSGNIELALGAEYDRDLLSYHLVVNPYGPNDTIEAFRRTNSAAFAEARVPLVARDGGAPTQDVLVITLAGRVDHYSDFGSRVSPQFGLEWRPSVSWLIRGSYSKAFKAPSLSNLYNPTITSPDNVLVDPKTGAQIIVPVLTGGNPDLLPITGTSDTIGIVYSSEALRGLRLAVTHWNVNEENAISSPDAQFLLSNESSYPGRVARNSAGQVTEIDATSFNFGSIKVAGIDYQIGYSIGTSVGAFSPSLNLTQTYKYWLQITPGAPRTSGAGIAQDSQVWSPRLKGTAALDWTNSFFAAHIAARYVGKYRDYDPLLSGEYQTLGNFWLADVNLRYEAGKSLFAQSHYLRGSYLEAGGVNIFNSLPQFSMFQQGFIGYDIAQGDIRGRFLYVRAGAKF